MGVLIGRTVLNRIITAIFAQWSHSCLFMICLFMTGEQVVTNELHGQVPIVCEVQ